MSGFPIERLTRQAKGPQLALEAQKARPRPEPGQELPAMEDV